MRYFARLAYKGTHYFGWQRQPNAISVQEVIEDALSTILRQPTAVTGCGRTDTGVHAKDYYLHFDSKDKLPDSFCHRLNKLLPKDIAFYELIEVDADAHARYDATYRSYEYHIVGRKSPFTIDTAFYYYFLPQVDSERMQAAAQLLLDYEDFFPFCKTNTDSKTMKCQLFQSTWEQKDEAGQHLVFHIAANRFLRGMVRLIVGMCLNVGLGKTTLAEVQQALEQQERLKRSWSVPPEGLYLNAITYPYIKP
ncbi:MAG: tRNA pseudouridine(38-40) synthase TruA [Bacteroidota bacterium]